MPLQHPLNAAKGGIGTLHVYGDPDANATRVDVHIISRESAAIIEMLREAAAYLGDTPAGSYTRTDEDTPEQYREAWQSAEKAVLDERAMRKKAEQERDQNGALLSLERDVSADAQAKLEAKTFEYHQLHKLHCQALIEWDNLSAEVHRSGQPHVVAADEAELLRLVARALWDHDHSDMPSEWRDMAWADMGGSEASEERAAYEVRASMVVLPIIRAELANPTPRSPEGATS